MQKQLDFLQQELNVQPSLGREGPRLWVRRVVIWEKRGGDVIRDIKLRPGLNIIWTPDDRGIGHGGGKTLFCRILRYCLGEDRFASGDLRERIGEVFPDGVVGAEVMLDGMCWAIVRPLGTHRRHLAVRDANLHDVIADETKATSISPFLDAVEQVILTEKLSSLIPSHRQEKEVWLTALAWLARDQECRFNHVLDWRSSSSDSNSPARGLSQTEKLDALRVFLQAITPGEQSKRSEISQLEEKRRSVDQEIGHRRWEMQNLKDELLSDLDVTKDGLADGDLVIQVLRRAAKERLEGLTELTEDEGVYSLEAARKDYETAHEELVDLRGRIKSVEAEIPNIERVIGKINGEYPSLTWALKEAKSVPCPICEVPVDRVLASKCELSHKLPDLEACRQRLDRNRKELESETVRLRETRKERNEALAKLDEAQNKERHAKERLRKIEAARDKKQYAWYSAKRQIDNVERLANLVDQLKSRENDLHYFTTTIQEERDRLGSFQDQQERVFGELSQKFGAIVRFLLGEDAEGSVKLTGNGLNITVQMGGNRSTAAIDSLKVVAFDVAALCMSIEGATRVPAFLIHDSPREADLGLNVYHGLFYLVHRLERMTDKPAFQYLITTTTRPPSEFEKIPWLCLTLQGAPSSERLLRHDL